MDNQKESKDDLEYNDDLGDLLREREKLEFSWVKTSVVVAASLAVILLGLTLVFKTGKQYIADKNDAIDMKTIYEQCVIKHNENIMNNIYFDVIFTFICFFNILKKSIS